MIPIENENRIDWNKLRAEYIAGGISYREMAAKYGIAFGTIRHRGQVENWVALREKAVQEVGTRSAQKIADAVADNATIAAELKKKLLLRLQRIEKAYPLDATEVRSRAGGSTAIFRIRDLTAAYKDLTEDLQTGSNATNELLESLIALERRAGL